VVCEYRISKAVQGEYDAPTARVAQWAIQDGERIALSSTGDEPTGRLILERFEDNPQLESLYLSETLAARPDLPLLYLVGESR
jgi:hypothetical protein